MKKNYDSIDLFKFIFSILIVALHADALYDLSPLANALICGGIARLGVPFFFVASAFFFFKKPVAWENTKRYCKRLLILYAAWFIVSLPKTVFDRFICSDYPLPDYTVIYMRACRVGLQNNDPQYREVLVCHPLRSFNYMAYFEASGQKRLRMA